MDQLLSVAATPVPREDEGWMDIHASHVRQARTSSASVVFLGDSITEGWAADGLEAWERHFAPLGAMNFGIGGDRTQHVLWRIQNGGLGTLTPSTFMLMIGTNNIYEDTATDIAQGIKEIVSTLLEKFPSARILLLGIFPRNDSAAITGKINDTNRIISTLDNKASITYMDISRIFVGLDGRVPLSLMPDGLHLSSRGYDLWANAVDATLRNLLEPA